MFLWPLEFVVKSIVSLTGPSPYCSGGVCVSQSSLELSFLELYTLGRVTQAKQVLYEGLDKAQLRKPAMMV